MREVGRKIQNEIKMSQPRKNFKDIQNAIQKIEQLFGYTKEQYCHAENLSCDQEQF